jgi:hypothetical protein
LIVEPRPATQVRRGKPHDFHRADILAHEPKTKKSSSACSCWNITQHRAG